MISDIASALALAPFSIYCDPSHFEATYKVIQVADEPGRVPWIRARSVMGMPFGLKSIDRLSDGDLPRLVAVR